MPVPAARAAPIPIPSAGARSKRLAKFKPVLMQVGTLEEEVLLAKLLFSTQASTGKALSACCAFAVAVAKQAAYPPLPPLELPVSRPSSWDTCTHRARAVGHEIEPESELTFKAGSRLTRSFMFVMAACWLPGGAVEAVPLL